MINNSRFCSGLPPFMCRTGLSKSTPTRVRWTGKEIRSRKAHSTTAGRALCINHPEYRQSRNALVEACVRRFMSHPAVTTWDVHNEPCLGHAGYPCYCNHTVDAYRKAVSAEFESIGQFNSATGQGFASFETIEPPREVAGAAAVWRHWREFMTANLSLFLLEARDIVKRYNPDALVTYNVDPVSTWRIQQNVLDWWTSRDLDFLTTSQYAGSDESHRRAQARLTLRS